MHFHLWANYPFKGLFTYSNLQSNQQLTSLLRFGDLKTSWVKVWSHLPLSWEFSRWNLDISMGISLKGEIFPPQILQLILQLRNRYIELFVLNETCMWAVHCTLLHYAKLCLTLLQTIICWKFTNVTSPCCFMIQMNAAV